MTKLDVAAYQRDELLGGKPGVRKLQAACSGCALQECFDLETLALGSGAPEYLTERRQSGHFGEDDPVQGNRVGRTAGDRENVGPTR